MQGNTLIVTLTRDELQDLVINSVKAVLAYQPAHRDPVPDEAAPTYVNKREAARLLSVCPSTIDNAARKKRLTRHYIGKSVRFERVQVLALTKKKQPKKCNVGNTPTEPHLFSFLNKLE